MAIIGIVAIARNFAIGKDGKLPWHYPADLKFFKETTTGNAIVMGSNTWRSIGRPLPNRLNVVVSRSGIVETPPEVMKLAGKDEVIELARSLNRDVYIIGGAEIFDTFADVIEKWIVTEVPDDARGADIFIDADFLDGFDLAETRELGDGLHVKIMQRK